MVENIDGREYFGGLCHDFFFHRTIVAVTIVESGEVKSNSPIHERNHWPTDVESIPSIHFLAC